MSYIITYTTVQFNDSADSYLGMSIDRSTDGHVIKVSQTGSINELINSHLTDRIGCRHVQ
jgi:hypothetical protein